MSGREREREKERERHCSQWVRIVEWHGGLHVRRVRALQNRLYLFDRAVRWRCAVLDLIGRRLKHPSQVPSQAKEQLSDLMRQDSPRKSLQ